MWHEIVNFLIGNPDGVVMAFGLLPLAGAASGFFQGREQRKAQESQQAATQQRINQVLQMTRPENFLGYLPGFQNAAAPWINAAGQSNYMAAQMAANSQQAGLARLGLGGTGLGSALGGGLLAGASFSTNALRARMMQDIFNEAIQAQMGRASLVAGLPIAQAPTASPTSGAIQGAGSGLMLGGQLLGQGFFGMPGLG
jgi:hypothetical protein